MSTNRSLHDESEKTHPFKTQMRCGNCGALVAHGVPFCLVCKQEVDAPGKEPDVALEPAGQESLAEGSLLAPAQPSASPDGRFGAQGELQHARVAHPRRSGASESLSSPTVSRWRSGPASPSPAAKVFITVLLLRIAPIGGFWGWTVLIGLVYFPFTFVVLRRMWRKHQVDESASPDTFQALWWVGVAAVVMTYAIPYIPRHHDYPCTDVEIRVSSRLDEHSYSSFGPAYAVPSGKEEGSWILAVDTAQHGPSAWAFSGDPAGQAEGDLFPANDAAVQDSVEREATPYQPGMAEGMVAMHDEQAIAAALDCLAQRTATPSQ